MSVEQPAQEESVRSEWKAKTATKIIAVGTALAAVGIVMSLSPLQQISGSVALFGLATSIYGLHRFGRSGRQ